MWCTSRCAVVKGGVGCRGPCGLWVVGYGRASDHDGCRGDDEFNFDDVLDHHVDHHVDHVIDLVGAVFLFGGLSLSGYMTPLVALGLLIGFLMFSAETYRAEPLSR